VDYIAVKGIVKPLGESLQSINKKDVTGVIQKLSVREHVVARTSAGYWWACMSQLYEHPIVMLIIL